MTINIRQLRILCLTIIVGCLPILPGCSAENDTGPGEGGKPKIALVMKSLANEFFVRMAEGARQHQAAHADQYELVINGIKDESDLTQQVALVEQMIAARADAIIVAPADSKALVPVIKRAMKRGIKVVNIDNKLDADILDQAGISVPFVGPDNREGARIVGEHLSGALQAGDKVAIIGGIPTAFNAQQRQLGFEDAMKAAGIPIVSIQNGDWQQAKASTIAAALITEYPDLKAILCSNDTMAMGAAAAIKQAGKEGTIRLVGFDNIEATHELLKSGVMLATADQYGDQLAVFGIEAALKMLHSEITLTTHRTPVVLITTDKL